MNEEINKCIEILKVGGIILYPTDTIWGIGCDATNEAAVQKIYELKNREDSKSMIVLVGNDGMLNKHVKDISDLAWDLIDLSVKPTTIVYQNAKNLASNVMAKDKSIAIRMVKEGFVNQLLFKYRKPIVSTSANISGKPAPQHFDEISDKIKNNVNHIVSPQWDTGNKQPSAIIKLDLDGKIEVIRK